MSFANFPQPPQGPQLSVLFYAFLATMLILKKKSN